MTEALWFRDGLRFECVGCGNCCRNHSEYEYVYVAEADILAISSFLSISPNRFVREYCEEEDGYLSFVNRGANCLFLEKEKCHIYPVRPKQCSTWPFWTENLKRETWEGPVTDCCPGIGKGTLYSAEQILRISMERDNWYC